MYYILVGRAPMAVDMLTWSLWFGGNIEKRRVAFTEIDGGAHVSTVFLGLDHNYLGVGEPLLFETLVFGGPLADEMKRYSTYEQAERGHAEMVAQAKIAAAKIKSIADGAGAKQTP
jgi:hypothetical protein